MDLVARMGNLNLEIELYPCSIFHYSSGEIKTPNALELTTSKEMDPKVFERLVKVMAYTQDRFLASTMPKFKMIPFLGGLIGDERDIRTDIPSKCLLASTSCYLGDQQRNMR